MSITCGRLGDGLKRRLGHGLRRADEGDDGPIRVGTGVHVQQLHARDGLNGVGNGLDLGPIAAFGKIGHAFDDLGWHIDFNSLVVQASRLQPDILPKQGGLGKALAFPPYCGDIGGFRVVQRVRV